MGMCTCMCMCVCKLICTNCAKTPNECMMNMHVSTHFECVVVWSCHHPGELCVPLFPIHCGHDRRTNRHRTTESICGSID